MIRLKYVSSINEDVLEEDADPGFEFLYVDISAVGQGTLALPAEPTHFAVAPSRARRLAVAGDTVVSTVRTYLRAVTEVPATEGPLVFSTGFAVISPDRQRVYPRYLTWQLQADNFISTVESISAGVSYPATSAAAIGDIGVRIPPLNVQRAVADFLDRETAKIDALIAKQEELVDALNEHRTAVVSSAAPSSLEAMGWPLDKLGRRTRIGNGSTPSRDNPDYWEDGTIPWMNSSVVNQALAVGPSALVTELAVAQCHSPPVRAGSLLVGLTGQGKTRGMATLTGIDTTTSQHLAFVQPSERHWDSGFLLWQLRASYGELRRMSDENGSTKGGLTCGDLASLRVAMPPLEQQTSMAARIDRETRRIDAVVDKARALMGTMRERRAALITAAVTGTLDVTTYGKAG
ncbi:restriction endonuclease subunit S [Arsenicicoccus sp. oral taxon 190]|uniref:restriction endonuclease subunit S n=1 Tax=Arsenicicoccus sp. oral taxon 190 TaxID=1658671 RepID=UPI00209FC381|nr:restriction endonuclease subunit S [Arsenicicoccus sp. oral taxon 190]